MSQLDDGYVWVYMWPCVCLWRPSTGLCLFLASRQSFLAIAYRHARMQHVAVYIRRDKQVGHSSSLFAWMVELRQSPVYEPQLPLLMIYDYLQRPSILPYWQILLNKTAGSSMNRHWVQKRPHCETAVQSDLSKKCPVLKSSSWVTLTTFCSRWSVF